MVLRKDLLKYEKFFPLSSADFCKIVAERNIKAGEKIFAFEDLSLYLHRNIVSGSIEIQNLDMLNQEVGYLREGKYLDFPAKDKYRILNEMEYGKNEIIAAKKKTLFGIIIHNMSDKTLALLFFASLISLFVGGYKMIEENDKYAWIEGTSILLAVIIIIMIGTINEFSQANLFARIDKKKQAHIIKFLSNYSLDTKNATDVIVGDILYLEPGDLVPADCIILSQDLVICDETLVSGESDPVEKDINGDCILISGAYIIEGVAKAMVICVGENSVKGKILKQMTAKDKKTPLEHKIESLAQGLAKKAIYIALILVVSHGLKFAFFEKKLHMREIMSLVVESLSIIVMAVPEGLPMAITLALSFGTKRMLKDNNLVREIAACEAMNNTNYICVDKTGTLTHNEMTIRYTYIGHHSLYIKNSFFKDKTKLVDIIKEHSNFDLTVKNMVLNSSAFQNSEGTYIGSRSESAILEILKSHHIDFNFLRREHQVLRRYPFSSRHKYMSSMIESSGKFIVFYKGAPETIAEHCTTELYRQSLIKFDEYGLNKFIKRSDRKCYRSLAFSYAIIDHFDPEAIKLGKYPCTFLCAIAMEDPVRENVKDRIEQCKNAGINIVMLTGDKIALAKNLAINLGILTSSNLCISGHVFRKMSDSDVGKILHNIKVVGRANPEDKKRFVELLQKNGNIVAVTGDGTNDGPALKTANVGFSMGLSGTDIAKEASSVILLDDNFSSLVKSVEWGRCINSSVRKFIQFQITTTISTVVIAIINSLLIVKGKSAFSPLKILWINIIMDTFAALAISTDKPTPDLLRKQPEPMNTPIILPTMKWFIFLSTTYQLLLIGTLYFFRAHNTYIFNTFVFLQIFNEINARSLDPFESPFTGLLYNKIFLTSNFVVLVLQFFIINNLSLVFKTQKMKFLEWVFSVSTAFSIILFFIIVRIFQRHKTQSCAGDFRRGLRYLKAEFQLLAAFKDFGNTAFEI